MYIYIYTYKHIYIYIYIICLHTCIYIYICLYVKINRQINKYILYIYSTFVQCMPDSWSTFGMRTNSICFFIHGKAQEKQSKPLFTKIFRIMKHKHNIYIISYRLSLSIQWAYWHVSKTWPAPSRSSPESISQALGAGQKRTKGSMKSSKDHQRIG